MFLTRRVTRSYDELHQVELTPEILHRIMGLAKAYGYEDTIYLDDMTNADWQQIWNYLDELHMESGDVIFMDDSLWADGTDDVCEYEINEESILQEEVYL